MSGDADGQEIIVRPMGDRVIALGPRDSTGWQAVPEPVACVVRELLNLKSDTPIGEQVYALSPQSQKRLKTDRKSVVGEYFRGTLLDDKGHYSHSLQLREVDHVPAKVPDLNLAMAAQMAALQAEIEALRELAEQIAADVREILDFLRFEQAADIAAAVNTVNEVFDAVLRRGLVGHVDWTRVAGLEHVLRKQATQVEQELEAVRDSLDFNGRVVHDFEATKRVEPRRVEALLQMTIVIERALEQHAWLQLAYKDEVGEFDADAARELLTSLQRARKRRRRLAKKIRRSASDAPQVEGRPWYERLVKDGIVVGGERDRSRASAVRALQAELKTQEMLKRATVTPPPPFRLKIEGPGDGAKPA